MPLSFPRKEDGKKLRTITKKEDSKEDYKKNNFFLLEWKGKVLYCTVVILHMVGSKLYVEPKSIVIYRRRTRRT